MSAAGGTIVLALYATLAVLTAVGERRRQGSASAVVLAGLAFPIAWIVWYHADERPRARRTP